MGFVKDLRSGKAAEQQLSDLFNSLGIKTEAVSVDERQFYDLHSVFPGGNPSFTTEVKFDIYEKRSGNIAIEIWNPKKNAPSGLTLTKADIWAHILSDGIFLASTRKLRAYIDKNPPDRYINVGGDGNAALNLYHRDKILPSVFQEVGDGAEGVIDIIKGLLDEG